MAGIKITIINISKTNRTHSDPDEIEQAVQDADVHRLPTNTEIG